MAKNTEIGWTHFLRPDGTSMPGHTANLWWGCKEVHEGCDNCYARVLAHRWGQELWGNDVPRRAVKSVWKDLNKYQNDAAAAGEKHAVFVGSMMDIFEKPMPLVDIKGQKIMLDDMDEVGMDTGDLRNQLFSNISKNEYPNLLFLFLTKRPSNINKYIPEAWKMIPPANVMFGTSVVNQETADKLIPQLLEAPGKKFLSMEPMLGLITMDPYWLIGSFRYKGQIDWVICGGESGHGRRPFDVSWAYDLYEQCKAANTPFFMKQIDKVIPVPEDLLIREFPVI